MPPRKKAKKSTPEPDEPLDYIAHIREKSAERFVSRKKNVNYEIEQNVREIRALLKINAEIFGRCIESSNDYDDGEFYTTFKRYGFDVVKVRPHQSTTQFITEPVHSAKSFDMKPLYELPAGLDDVFVAKYQATPFNTFIDYDEFFQMAIMLHDDVLEPFLAKLKCHLETVHVCLGEIESWLLEPNKNIELLEETFGKKLEIPTADDINNKIVVCDRSHTHASSDVCLGCRHTFGEHVPPYQKCPNSNWTQGYFKCKRFLVLKSCKESGTFEKTFTIGNKGDQAKLKKLLEFMAM